MGVSTLGTMLTQMTWGRYKPKLIIEDIGMLHDVNPYEMKISTQTTMLTLITYWGFTRDLNNLVDINSQNPLNLIKSQDLSIYNKRN